MGCGSSKSKPIGDAPPPNVPQPLVQTGGDPLAVFDTFEYSIGRRCAWSALGRHVTPPTGVWSRSLLTTRTRCPMRAYLQ